MPEDLSANVDRFTGFADCYDAYRPTPPSVVVDVLTMLARVPGPKLFVDIGCGTGLSTLIWADRAEGIVGVEPSADMSAGRGSRGGARWVGEGTVSRGAVH